MKTLSIIVRLLPPLVAAVKEAERAMPAAGQGQAKKELVLSCIRAAYQADDELRNAIDFDRLVALCTELIAGIVAVFNAFGVFKTSK